MCSQCLYKSLCIPTHCATYQLTHQIITLTGGPMLWTCRHTSNMPLLCLWPPIHWFINSVMLTINPLGLLTPASRKWRVTTVKSIHHLSHLCSIKMHFALVSWFQGCKVLIFSTVRRKGTRTSSRRDPFLSSCMWALSWHRLLVITASSYLGSRPHTTFWWILPRRFGKHLSAPG